MTAPIALCILTRSFNQEWVHFLSETTAHEMYDVYMVVDTAPSSPPLPTGKINIITISDDECRKHNYYNSSTASNLKDIVAWDKALYYFNRICSARYEHIWFIEDDVFLYSTSSLQNIDTKYPTSDILCSFHEKNETGDIYRDPNTGAPLWDHWVNVIYQISLPWSHSLISACRMSARLMGKIDEYVQSRPLFFIEALFTTLALQNNYVIDTPTELSGITYDYKWADHELNDPTRLYHPLKNIENHKYYREKMPPRAGSDIIHPNYLYL